MRVVIKSGDLLDELVDVVISTANVYLDMSGGVNAAILQRGGQDVQKELHDYLRQCGKTCVTPATVVPTSPGPLPVRLILHAVAVDAFHDSSVSLVKTTIENALVLAASRKAETVALPALATGYGRMTKQDFAQALREALKRENLPIQELRVVLRQDSDVLLIKAILERK